MKNKYTLLIGLNSELAQFFLLNTTLNFENLILVTHSNKPSRKLDLILKKYSKLNVLIYEADLKKPTGYLALRKYLESFNIARCFYFSAINQKDSNIRLNSIDEFYNLNSFAPIKLVYDDLFKKCHFILIGSLLSFVNFRDRFNYGHSKSILNFNYKLMKNKPAILNFGPVDSKNTNLPKFLTLSKNNLVIFLDKIAKKNIRGIFIHPFFWKIGLPLLRFISR